MLMVLVMLQALDLDLEQVQDKVQVVLWVLEEHLVEQL